MYYTVSGLNDRSGVLFFSASIQTLHSISTSKFYAMKTTTFIFLFLFSFNVFAQLSNISISTGLVYSDIRDTPITRHNDTYDRLNDTKRGFYLSGGATYKVNPHFGIEVNLTYQERKALEVFQFPSEDGQGGVLFGKYPTSPQSEIYDASVYKHFPNFKYLHWEFIPTFEIGERTKWGIGLGFFVGKLLNPQQMTYTKEDFPTEAFLFQDPFNTNPEGKVAYQVYDLGALPKISFHYPITSKVSVGVHSKLYLSRSLLNDTFKNVPETTYNYKWQAFFVGMNLRYELPNNIVN